MEDSDPLAYTSQPTGQPLLPSGVPPITNQPGAPPMQGSGSIAMPRPVEGVPPGLEYLTMVDTVVVQQMIEMVEILTGCERQNKYSLKNANGEQIYFATEQSDCCERQFCRANRPFDIFIVDNFQREVMIISRPFKCWGGCCCLASYECCAHECTIESPPGRVIGTVMQRQSYCNIGLSVRDEKGEEIFDIDGPDCCEMMGCCDKEFVVNNVRGEEVGIISKKWGGFLREAFTDADIFYVKFPMDLDLKMKAVLIGATFLIDFMAFEQQPNG